MPASPAGTQTAAQAPLPLPHRPQVDVYTAHYDPARCFEETRSGLFSVMVAGAWFPRNVLGRLHAVCAYVRCLLVALYIAWRSRRCGWGGVLGTVGASTAVVAVRHMRRSLQAEQ